MNIKDNEILFIYNSKLYGDKQALGYVIPLDKHKIKEFDLMYEKLTERQIAEIADRMNVELDDLLDKSSDAYKNNIHGATLEPHDKLKVMRENPDTLKTPIAITTQKAVYVTDPYSLIKDDMEIDGVRRGYKGSKD